MHDLAGAEAGGEQRARRTPEIRAAAFGLEDRTGRHQQPPRLAGRRDVEAAERRMLPSAAPAARICAARAAWRAPRAR